MERLVRRYYKFNRFFLSVIGLWPYQSERSACLMRIVTFTFLLTSLIAQVFAIVKIYSVLSSELTMEFIAAVLPTILPTFGFLLQLYIRIKLIDKLKELFDRMWDDWALQKTYNEIKIMHEHAKTTKLWTLSYLGMIYLTVITYNIWLFTPEILDIISPMNESRPRIQIPYIRLEVFIDEERHFYLIRLLLCIGLSALPLVPLAYSTLFVVLTQHVCAMCELLGFIGIIDNYYTIPCLVDLIEILIVASLAVFQISTFAKIEDALRSIGFTLISLCYVFMFNYMGEKVTNESSNICEKVYNSAWYDAVVSEQKLLLLINQRRFHPIILTAWFYVFSLSNFGLVLRTIISYCMFIRTVGE